MKDFRPIRGRWAVAALFLLTEGCTSFVFSRFTPDPSEHGSTTCGGYAPIVDVVLGMGAFALCGLGNSGGLAENRGEPRGPLQVTPCVPLFINLASIAYGVTAEIVCTTRVRSSASDRAATSAGVRGEQ